MKFDRLLRKIVLSLAAAGYAGFAAAAPQEFEIANFDRDDAPCQIKIPVTAPWTQCTADGCEMPAPAGSTLGTIRLRFSCLPKSAPTGFENPPPDVRVESIRATNTQGHVSLIDSIDEPADERTRELNFCLFGERYNFCGFAQTLRLKDGAQADSAAAIRELIRRVELH